MRCLGAPVDPPAAHCITLLYIELLSLCFSILMIVRLISYLKIPKGLGYGNKMAVQTPSQIQYYLKFRDLEYPCELSHMVRLKQIPTIIERDGLDYYAATDVQMRVEFN